MTFANRMPKAVTIGVARADNPSLAALIAESQDDLLRHFPAEEIFTLSIEELAAPNCHLLLARHGTDAVGCVALVDQLEYGEIKRLFVRETCRGMGIARGLIAEAELLAGEIGLRLMRLETGHPLTAAIGLYRSMGYADRGAFGAYPQLDSSLFLEKQLF
ncbi:MAG: GNAT family N-acetyltransferase [Pseudomonadota bacterium]